MSKNGNDEPNSLPHGWEWATLGELATSVKNGIYVSRPGTEPSGIPILRIGAVRPMKLSMDDLRYTGLSLAEVEAKDGLARPGDLLFTRYNGNPSLVGACARVPSGTFPIAYPDKLIRVTLPDSVADSRFLCYAWAWSATQQQVRLHVKTTAGQAGISGTSLKSIRLPIPPLAEQRRIVDALEDHFSRLDAATATLHGLTRRARDLMPRMMGEYFSGADHSRVRLDSVAEVRLGRQRSPKNHVGEQMRPYLRAANVGWSGLLLDDVKEMNFTDKEVETYRLSPGDVLLSEASGSPGEVGKPALWLGGIDECCFQNTLLRVRADRDSASPRYLHYFLWYEARRGSFRSGARGVGIHHLGAAKLAGWQVPLPPLDIQNKIVELLDGEVSKLQAATLGAEALLGRSSKPEMLRRTILNHAFSGRLVASDPGEEPASDVLARAAAAGRRAAIGKSARRRATKPPRITTAQQEFDV